MKGVNSVSRRAALRLLGGAVAGLVTASSAKEAKSSFHDAEVEPNSRPPLPDATFKLILECNKLPPGPEKEAALDRALYAVQRAGYLRSSAFGWKQRVGAL